jgi:hypothetical protein
LRLDYISVRRDGRATQPSAASGGNDMTTIPGFEREDAPPSFRNEGDLHPAIYLVMGLALLLGVAFGVHALFGMLL